MNGNTLAYPFRGIFDAELELHDGTALTATGAGSVDSAAAVINVGGTTPSDDIPAFAGMMVADISAIKISANDESYSFVLEQADDSGFTTNVEEVVRLTMGAKEVMSGTSAAVDSVVGRYAVPFHTGYARPGGPRQYLRLKVVIAGTSPTVTSKVWLTKSNMAV